MCERIESITEFSNLEGMELAQSTCTTQVLCHELFAYRYVIFIAVRILLNSLFKVFCPLAMQELCESDEFHQRSQYMNYIEVLWPENEEQFDSYIFSPYYEAYIISQKYESNDISTFIKENQDTLKEKT